MLLINWKQEAQRFTPSLKLTFLHPAENDRNAIERIGEAPEKKLATTDLAVTTYSMLTRQEWLKTINWNSSISAIAAFPDDLKFKDMKWGIRGRTMLEGYDLTLNYVREAEQNSTEIAVPINQRIGLSAKGDLGSFGVYGAIGYNFEDINNGDFSFLVGSDYSYFFESGSKIYFQLEYLSLREERLSSLLGAFALLDSSLDSESNAHLFLTRTSYDINEFSAISLFTISSLNDFSTIIMPNYSNQISNSLTFNCNFAYFNGKQNTLFGPGLIGGVQEKPKITIEAGFTYSF